jgi:hypothetical protein
MDLLEPPLLGWEDVDLSCQRYSIFDAIWSDLADGRADEYNPYQDVVDRIYRFKTVICGFDKQMRRLCRILSARNMGCRKFSSLFQFNGVASKVTNLCGMKKSLHRDTSGKLIEISGKHILCHILQGAESAFIHRLTALGAECDYFPLGNEHDGLIVFGIIRPEVLKRVRDELGLRYVVLEEKPFSDPARPSRSAYQ